MVLSLRLALIVIAITVVYTAVTVLVLWLVLRRLRAFQLVEAPRELDLDEHLLELARKERHRVT